MRRKSTRKHTDLRQNSGKTRQTSRSRALLSFLLSLAACTVIFGAFSYSSALISSLRQENSDAGRVNAPIGENSCNMLFMVEDDSSTSVPQTLLLCLDGSKNRIVLAPVPAALRVYYNQKSSSLSDVAVQGGPGDAAQAFTTLTGVKLEYYAAITLSNLRQMTDDLGGVIYSLPADLASGQAEASILDGSELTPGNQLLSGQKTASAIAAACRLSWQRRSTVQGELAKSFLIQKLNESYLGSDEDGASVFYKETFNYMKTNWSMKDMVNWIDLLRSLSVSNKNPINVVSLECEPQNAEPGSRLSFTVKDMALLRDYFGAGR